MGGFEPPTDLFVREALFPTELHGRRKKLSIEYYMSKAKAIYRKERGGQIHS